MQKHEFEKLAEVSVTDKTFEIVEFVYNFHPAIDEVKGKQQVADLFTLGGLRIFLDMTPTAQKAKALDEDIRKKTAELDALIESLSSLRNP
ncbi:conserved hypothetical protein [Gammaproteobacteria bacterium]